MNLKNAISKVVDLAGFISISVCIVVLMQNPTVGSELIWHLCIHALLSAWHLFKGV